MRRTSTRGLVMPVNYVHLHGGIGPVFIHCGERPIQSREDARRGIFWLDDIAQRASEHSLGQFEQRAREAAP